MVFYMSEELLEFKPGFTPRTALAILFASAMILPVSIYLSLVSGGGLASAAVYVTAILLSEIAVLTGNPLTTQEMFIIYSMVGIAATAAPFEGLVYRSYFVRSPITWSFKDPYTGKPLPEVIPTWWVPRYDSPVHELRTFFAPEWLIPILLLVGGYFMYVFYDISLTFLFSYLYIEIEKLPFPFASVQAEMSSTLAERDPKKLRVFILSAMVGLIYSTLLYGVPTLSYGMTGIRVELIPIPWIDLTSGYMGIENILPGAVFGIATDILAFLGGTLISFDTALYMLIGSIATWVIGNHLALTVFAHWFPEWVEEWIPASGLAYVYQRASIRVWIAPHIGFTLAVSIIVLARSYKSIIRAIKSLAKLSKVEKATGYPSPKILLLWYAGTVILSVIVFHALVGLDFPIWLSLLVALGWSFMDSLIRTRTIGETGYSISIPYVWQATILVSGYKGIEPWLTAPIVSAAAVPYWTQSMKAAYLTKTRLSDFFKAFIFTAIVFFVMSFVYVQFYWSIAPIPSSVYPQTLISWPVQAASSCLWISGQIFKFRSETLIYPFALMLSVGIIGEALSKMGIPFSLIGLLTGTYILPTSAVPTFIGAFISKYLAPKVVGKEWWNENKALIVAGVAAGEGILIGLATAIVMVSKATWILPF